MGYTNETTHYGLPLPLGSDLTTPMDYNTSLQAVDTALFGAVSDCSSMDSRLDTAEGNISTLDGQLNGAGGIDARLTTAEGKVSTLEGASTQQALDIADVRADGQDMICAYKEADAQSDHAYAVGDFFIYNDVLYKATETIEIGDTIVPDTNCTTSNVSNELIQIKSDLTGIETAISTTTSDVSLSITKDSGNIFVKKNGKVVTLTSGFSFTAGAISGAGVVFGNVPSGFRPNNLVRANCITSGGTSNTLEISSNGDIVVQGGGVASITYINAQVAWILD